MLWNFGDGTSDTGNTVQHTYNQSGTNNNVCMTVIDSLCSRTTCENVWTTNYLQAYPNPVQSNVYVSLPQNQYTSMYAYVYNSQGILVSQTTQQGNLLIYNAAGLPPGYYTIRIYTPNGVFISRFQKM